jgi:hypothetical protein
MIIYLAISCITLSFCAFTYLWVSNKWERKKDKEMLEAIMIDESTTRYRRRYGEGYYPDYFIPLKKKKEDFSPKKKMKYHTLEEPIEYYSEDKAEDEGCGCATVCDNCYDTTDYEFPF